MWMYVAVSGAPACLVRSSTTTPLVLAVRSLPYPPESHLLWRPKIKKPRQRISISMPLLGQRHPAAGAITSARIDITDRCARLQARPSIRQEQQPHPPRQDPGGPASAVSANAARSPVPRWTRRGTKQHPLRSAPLGRRRRRAVPRMDSRDAPRILAAG